MCRTRTGTLSLRALTSLTQPVLPSVAIWSRVFDVLRASAVVLRTARSTLLLLSRLRGAPGAKVLGAQPSVEEREQRMRWIKVWKNLG